MNGVRAWRAPVFLAADSPRLAPCLMTLVFCAGASAGGVAEPSSTTSTWKSVNVCLARDAKVALSQRLQS